MTYPEVIQFLHHLGWFGAKLGLDNPRRLAALAGHPQEQLRFIHVAGTNGKGSTCAMLESIYRAAGLRVGLYTSPHLIALGERIQVNRRMISEAEVARFVTGAQPWLKEFSPETHPTFFEIVTVMALRHFAEQKCDLVIWETGLGGRLDATNIVTPLASVITNVQWDHEKWLGHTLPEIAKEKAGIIKPGVPVVSAAEGPEVLGIIRGTADFLKAPLTLIAPTDVDLPPLNAVKLPLLGEHQRLNAALAVATVRALSGSIPVTEAALRTGLATVYWPGRFQVVKPGGGRTIVLDGAHNPAGAETLRAGLRKYFPNQRPVLALATMKDKDWASMCHILAPLAERIYLTPVTSERTALPEQMVPACREANPGAEISVCINLAEALQRGRQAPLLVVTGSLHFLGEAMELLNLSPGTAGGERGLNEWGAAR